MDISARSYVTAGISLTTATAIAFAAFAVPAQPLPEAGPVVTNSDVHLAASTQDIEALIADVQAAFLGATTSGPVVDVPGQTLIGLVDNIVTGIDVGFTQVMSTTDDPTTVESLDILKVLSVDAYKMLAFNLRRADPVITGAVSDTGELVTDGVAGSVTDMLAAATNVVNDPLSPASYTALPAAGIAGATSLAGNGVDAVRAVGGGAFGFGGIALHEVTFQFNNGVGGLSNLLGHLGDASGSPVVDTAVDTVRSVAVAPAVAAFNVASQTNGTVQNTAKTAFDGVADAASNIVDSTASAADAADDVVRPSSRRSAVTRDDDKTTKTATDSATLSKKQASERDSDATAASAASPGTSRQSPS